MLTLFEGGDDLPVSLEDLKRHCRVDFDDDDDVLGIYLRSAVEYVARETGRTLAPSVWLVRRPGFGSGCIDIPLAPLRDVVEMTIIDGSGERVVVDGWSWRRTPAGGAVEVAPGHDWPAADAVEIEVEAGYDLAGASGSGDDPELRLPVRLRLAVLMLAGHWYENREAVSDSVKAKLPLGVEKLLGQMKVFR